MNGMYCQLLAKKLIVEFEKRNMDGVYCESKEEALGEILSMLKKDDVISSGGSLTLSQIGFLDAMKGGGYRYLDPKEPQGAVEKEKVAVAAFSADYYFMSANAISETGELVNIDGIGNRTAALMFGPKYVVVVAGLNKVAPTLEAAVTRAKTYASRLCLTRYGMEYASFDELSAMAEKSGNHLVITKGSVFKGRVKIILVGEDLGA